MSGYMKHSKGKHDLISQSANSQDTPSYANIYFYSDSAEGKQEKRQVKSYLQSAIDSASQ